MKRSGDVSEVSVLWVGHGAAVPRAAQVLSLGQDCSALLCTLVPVPCPNPGVQ